MKSLKSKILLCFLMCFGATYVQAEHDHSVPEAHSAKKLITTVKNQTVVLQKSNTVVLNTSFNSKSIAVLQRQILEKDRELDAGVPIYLFLDTPGGSVVAGNDLIELMSGLNREIITVTKFAASMGFHTVQAGGKRLIMSTGVLMSHRARGGSRGQIPGELNVRVNFWTHYINNLNRQSAKRIGISFKKYHRKHTNEWWLTGKRAVYKKTADEVVKVKCGKTMTGTYTQKINTMFGSYKVEFLQCPLVSAPIRVRRSRNSSGVETKAEMESHQAVMMMLFNKRQFLDNYIVTGKQSPLF